MSLWTRRWKLLLLGLSFFSGFVSIIVLYPTKLIPSVYEIWWKGFNKGNKESESKVVKNKKFGNAQGIIEKLPYIKSLGVDYVWITPFFQSLQLDNGYDISDYYHVDSLFGTDADFKDLLKEARNNNLKVIVDLVLNHTSNQHPWFQWAIGNPVFYNQGKKKESDENNQKNVSFWVERERKVAGIKYKLVSFFAQNLKSLLGSNIPDSGSSPSVRQVKKYQSYYWFWNKEIKNIKDFDQNIKGKQASQDYPPFFHDNGLNDNTVAKNNIGGRPAYLDRSYQKFHFSEISNLTSKNNPFMPYSKTGSSSYYLHTFSDFQPDLNWNNPEVRKEMAKIANFYVKGQGWLKGEKVDGFRLDAIPLIGKQGNKNNASDYIGYYNPRNVLLVPGKDFESNLSGFRNKTYGPKNLFTIGELSQARADDERAKARNTVIAKENFTTSYLPIDTLWNFQYAGDGSRAPSLKSWDEFYHIPIGKKDFGVFFNEFLQDSFNQVQDNRSALIAENHDQPRSVTRFGAIAEGTDEFYKKQVFPINPGSAINSWKYFGFSPRDINNADVGNRVLPRAKALALFKFFQQGIPIIYQGQEIGMDNYPFYLEDQGREIRDDNFVDSIDLQGKAVTFKMWMLNPHNRAYWRVFATSLFGTWRDHTRTPIQWNDQENAGWEKNMVFWNGSNDPRWEEKEKNVPFTSKGVYYAKKESGEEVLKRYVEKSDINLDDVKKDEGGKPLLKSSILSGAPLILNPHYKQINVQEQEQRLDSPLNFYRKLLYLRKTNSVLNQGSFKALTEGKDFKVLNHNEYDQSMTAAYTRSNFWGTKKYLVITNLDYQARLININLGNYLTMDRLLLNTHQGVNYQNNLLELQPYQGIVVEM